jgi:apolipoprotein N-acyltransferase
MKTEWVSEPVKKSIWVPGLVQVKKPKESHMKVVWTLWGISVGLLAIWLIGISLQYTMGGWINAFAVGAIFMAGVCTAYGFKYCEYWERPFMQRMRNRFGSRSVVVQMEEGKPVNSAPSKEIPPKN